MATLTLPQRWRYSMPLILILSLLITVGTDAGGSLASATKSGVAAFSISSVAAKGSKTAKECPAGSDKQECAAPPLGDESDGSVTAFLYTFQKSIISGIFEFWSSSTAKQLKFLIAGAVAGIVSRTAVSPLEVIATAQMVRGGKNAGIWDELASLLRNEGIRGFFKGNGANCLKVAPTRGIQFLAFEQFKQVYLEWKKEAVRERDGDVDSESVTLSPIERLIAGGFAGMIASSCVYPLEVVKTMLTMYPGKYAGIGAALRSVIAEAGYGGLYQGLAPTLVAMFPYVGIEFMIYETSKIFLEDLWHGSIPIIISLGLGAMAGASAQTSAHPFDVVRKRLQVQGINGNPVLYKNTIDCFLGVAKKEGSGALYKGLGPACVATIPGTGIAYITYEMMKKVLGLSSV